MAPAPLDFGDLKTGAGLEKLNAHLKKNSYIAGFNATQDDNEMICQLSSLPTATYPYISRWMQHVMYFSEAERSAWPKGQGKGTPTPQASPPAKKSPGPKAAAKKVDDDDDSDFDPFAEETAEEKDAKEAMKKKIQDAPKAKKVVINKSTLVIEVKPVSTNIDLDQVEKLVRELKIDGLEWSRASKKVPIAYGLMKLQIGCVIVDNLVNTDVVVDMVETVGLNEEDSKKKIAIRDGEIEVEDEDEDEDFGLVQSAEIVSFNKL